MTLPKPVICAVNGVAAGAGASIALACDIVLAARSANFVQVFCKIGLIPDSGGTWNLPRAVGLARARGLAMLGDQLSAEQAQAWGMIWRCIDDARFLQDEAPAGPPAGHPADLRPGPDQARANASASNSFDEQLDLERDLQRLAGRSEDYREGVSAFIAKRTRRVQGPLR